MTEAKKVKATKENARKAVEELDKILEKAVDWYENTPHVEINFLQDFLEAASRKLPSEAAYEREVERSRKRDRNRGR